jgi:hydrogenase-4 component B
MLVPQALLAALCLVFGLFPGLPLGALERILVFLPGLTPWEDMALGGFGMASGLNRFDRVVPGMLGLALVLALAATVILTKWRRARRAPTWGCGGELTARTEYTASAFSRPLMMIFQAIYRPTHEVEALAEASPYFPREVRYRAEIEPTFERYFYRPLLRAVLRGANGMKVLQAGSLHAYLAYVLALAVVLLMWLGGPK